jgi:hypothetical protein
MKADISTLVSRETLRKWMTKAALWAPRTQRVKAVHVWRERRARFGELVTGQLTVPLATLVAAELPN